MKAKQMIFKIFVILLIVAILPLVNLKSMAEDGSMSFEIQYKKHAEEADETGKAYAYNTSSSNATNHPIFQIIGKKDGVAHYGYYCLNATAGETWMGERYLENGEIPINQVLEYNESYDLTDPSDLAKLKEDTSSAYGKIVNSEYFNQILWILKNMYIKTGDDEVDAVNRKQLLDAAGIKYSEIELNSFGPGGLTPMDPQYAYKYVPQEGFANYLSTEQNSKTAILNPNNVVSNGWYYFAESTNEFTPVILPDELIEVAQQAAIWYFANYLGADEESKNDQYDIRTQGLQLKCSDNTEGGTSTWPALVGLYERNTNVSGYKAVKGTWYQDQATILCWYLIDAAQKYGNIENATNKPAKVVVPEDGRLHGAIQAKMNNDKNCYVFGPIKISGETPYTLLDTIQVDNVDCTDYYILTEETQTTATSGKLSEKIQENSIKQNGFYIAIPENYVGSISKLKIEFNGQYKDSEVTLWKDQMGVEQPIATSRPVVKDFKLLVANDEEAVDLALTKFITAVSNDMNIEDGEYITADKHIGSKENPYLRATAVDTFDLKNTPGTHDAVYTRDKTPLLVPIQSYVLYNIRVYNEGDVDVYAAEIEDQLPDNLDYVDCEFNTNYRWKLESDGKTVRTDFLSHEVDAEKNLLKKFDRANDDEHGSGLDYRDVQILCRVNINAPVKTKLINTAEISKYEDETGKEFEKDVDSFEHNRTDKNQEKRQEDDDDWEVVLVQTFDLSLLKWVSTVYVTEDGVTTTTETGNTGNDSTDIIPKVEVNKKKLDDTVVRFGYTIQITNEGEIAGYAKEITDYVPEGLKFYEEDNTGWTDEGNNVISTRLLENKLLQPGESAQVTVILRWINGADNLNMKTNIAEISEDYNEYGAPDIDSDPDNKKDGEDDIDDASVLLALSTGFIMGLKAILPYAGGIMGVFAILAIWTVFIKKYVL